MGFEEDIGSGIWNSALGAFTATNISILGIIGMLFLPAFALWGGLSIIMLYLMLLRNFVLIFPNAWKFRVIVSKPYGDGSIGLDRKSVV